MNVNKSAEGNYNSRNSTRFLQQQIGVRYCVNVKNKYTLTRRKESAELLAVELQNCVHKRITCLSFNNINIRIEERNNLSFVKWLNFTGVLRAFS